MKRIRDLFFALALGAVLAPAAFGHAVLVESNPADGAVLVQSPPAIELRFNEPVAPTALRLLDRTGRDLAVGLPLAAIDQVVTLRLVHALGDGAYVASYRVVSADGHPVAGAVLFRIGDATATPPASDEGALAWVAVLASIRAAHYAGLLVAAGGALFLVLIAGSDWERGRQVRRGIGIASGLAVITALLGIAVNGAILRAVPAAELLAAETWHVGGATSLGASAVVLTAGLAVVLAGLAIRVTRVAGTTILVGVAVAIGSLALTGHAAMAPPRWLSSALVVVHGLIAAFWVGGLWPLLIGLGRTGDVALLRSFSHWALPSVLALIAAGTGLAALQLGSLDALWGSPYGHRLLVKLALVTAMLAAAIVNRWWLAPALAAGRPDAARLLAGSIRIELGAAGVILLVTAAIGTVPPPRVEQDTHAMHAHPTAMEAIAAGTTARLTIASEHAARYSISVSFASGRAVMPREVSAWFAQGEHGVEGLSRPMTRTDSGYVLTGMELVPAGRWRIRIDALVSDFEKVMFEFEVMLR